MLQWIGMNIYDCLSKLALLIYPDAFKRFVEKIAASFMNFIE